LALLTACGGAGTKGTSPTTETGTVAVQLIWPNGVPSTITTITSTVTVGAFQASESQSVDQWANSTQSVTAPVGTGMLRVDAANTAGSVLFSGSATVSVAANVLTQVVVFLVPQSILDAPISIQVTPPASTVAAGTTQTYKAIGKFADETTRDITGSVIWISTNSMVASIDATGLATGLVRGSTSIVAFFSNSMANVKSPPATLTVTPAVVTALQITPSIASIPAGTTEQYTAVATFSDRSTQDVTALAIWNAGVDGVATINGTGLATGLVMGDATVTAMYNGVPSNMGTLTVTPALLTSIEVSPSAASIPSGTTQQFTATGTYTDKSKKDLTATAGWSTDNSTVATVSGSGLATGNWPGVANIAATSSGITSVVPAVLTVTPAALVSIQVTPGTASVAVGTTQQYTAVGTYTDKKTLDITASVFWSSSDTSLATIGLNGLATGVALGTVDITATSSDALVASNAAILNVTPAVLMSIQVTPPIRSIAKGTAQQFIAVGTYSDKNIQDITDQVSWGSDNTSVATISMGGLATGVTMGTANISANFGTVTSNTAILTVTEAALTSIQVSPASASIAAGSSQHFAATGVYTDFSTQDLTSVATWSSDAPGVATITGPGAAKGVAPGTANITASVGAVTSNAAVLTVTSATLVSIQVTPATAIVAEGTTQQFAATGTYSDGSTQTITGSVAWGSSNTEVATISRSGLATGLDEGTVNVTASFGGIASNSAALTVTSESLVSIRVTPAAASIAVGRTQNYVATGTYTDGSVQTITKMVAWASSNTSVATISTGGLATGVTAGTVNISASLGTVTSNTATLTVTPVTLVSILVTPATASIAKCATQQFTATGTYSDGSSQDLTAVSSWISGATSVATIGSTGLATGVSAGSTSITATFGGMTSIAAVTVTSATVCDADSNGDDHGVGDGDNRDGLRDGDDHSRRGDDRHRGN
jgi:uncharacterized protein YjdB